MRANHYICQLAGIIKLSFYTQRICLATDIEVTPGMFLFSAPIMELIVSDTQVVCFQFIGVTVYLDLTLRCTTDRYCTHREYVPRDSPRGRPEFYKVPTGSFAWTESSTIGIISVLNLKIIGFSTSSGSCELGHVKLVAYIIIRQDVYIITKPRTPVLSMTYIL